MAMIKSIITLLLLHPVIRMIVFSFLWGLIFHYLWKIAKFVVVIGGLALIVLYFFM